MTIWAPDLADAQGPIYRSIADALARDVESGELQAGDRLPTLRELARRLDVNVMTVSRAYKEAARRGLVEGEVGRGTFVRRPPPAVGRLAQMVPQAGSASGGSAGPDLIDFHFNLPAPDPSILDVETVLAELAGGAGRELLFSGYTTTGLPDHRAAGAEWLRRFGVEADPARVVVCGGGQHAMTLAFATLTRPGDLVATSELTYPGMKGLANVLGLRLHGLPMDEEGLLPDAFETVCARGGVKVLYVMPTVHNPTGVVLPEERRHALVESARRHGVTLVEDDTYGYLCPEPPPSLASLAPELVYFLASTAKNLTPGLRIGYLLAPFSESSPDLAVERLAANIAATSWMAAPLMAEIAARWIRDGSADRMLEWKRREACARRRSFDRIVGVETDGYPGASHVWLRLPSPWRCADFVAQARQRGVALTPSEAFVVGRAEAPHAVRVCLGTPRTRDEVKRGLAVLADMLAGSPDVVRSVV